MLDLQLVGVLEERVQHICNEQARYRVLFVTGPARSGKTQLCKKVCERNGWDYVNYTNNPAGLERIRGRERTYSPANFISDLEYLCEQAGSSVVVIDEIEPLLSRWRSAKQEDFFRRVGRATGLHRGVVIVTRMWPADKLRQTLQPNEEHVFDVVEGS